MLPVELALPFHGRWVTQNSPANRVPSHGTDLFGSSHAIDFVRVDARGLSGARTWRTLVATEPPGTFLGIVAPTAGVVHAVHDGEEDHEARRSQLLLIGYALTQARRARHGSAGLAGNHVVIALAEGGPYVLLAHLRRGSVAVTPGQRVEVGSVVGACGNSGNSTEPHVHVQVSDSIAWDRARGLPMTFRRPGTQETFVPRNGEIVAGARPDERGSPRPTA
ncbi:M23 family metallopeptidase [Janibacter sp. GS2]|uniref:M23 family metallopeptidase n=1 Tax=Janibacter sp. GS2 TaxID=3442646 RepID=UPI003EBAEEF9